MHFSLKYEKDMVFVDKAAGIETCSLDKGTLGYLEILEENLKCKLYVSFQIGKNVTGALCFASSKKMAEELNAAFQKQMVKVKYLFLTDKSSQRSEITIESKTDGKIEEKIRKIKKSSSYELWEVETFSLQENQIRLIAAQVGLAILGDSSHGGSLFPTLCLHVQELHFSLDFSLEKSWVCPAPFYFENLEFLKDQEFIKILAAIDRRQRLYNFLDSPQECLRLIHTECADYRLDLFGEQMWLYWYKEEYPSPIDLKRWEKVSELLKRPLIIRVMKNRGKNPQEVKEWRIHEPKKNWIALEDNIRFHFKDNAGLSPGLFLDQWHNRFWLRQNSKNKRVLNLFSYTCGFSVVAALSEAKEIVSVDLSSNFLNWGKENFMVNNISSERGEFFSQDVEVFLNGCIKRNRKFDVIICDPPSFARKDKEIFQIEKKLPLILKNCWQILCPGGYLLMSTNYEKWTLKDLKKILQDAIGKEEFTKTAMTVDIFPRWDFELPNKDRLLKSLLIFRRFFLIFLMITKILWAPSVRANEDQWNFNLATGARSFPIGAGFGGYAAFNQLLWGKKTTESVAYGYLRPMVGFSTSGVVNKGTLKIEISPIAPLVFSSGYQVESTYTKLETIDCNIFECNHRLQKDFIAASFVFGILPWFAKLEQVIENQKSSQQDRPFADPDSSLTGVMGGKDQLVSSKIISGFLFKEDWAGGGHWSRSKFQDSQTYNQITDIFVRKKKKEWTFVGGVGLYESSYTESKSFFFILLEWKSGHSLEL